MPPAVMNLLIINALIFFAVNYMPWGGQLFDQLALYQPTTPWFRPWQPLTHMFVQRETWHLFTNLFSLWMFGRQAEWDLGTKRFLIYYLVCGLGAAALQLGVSAVAGPENIQMVGASGAVYGLLLAFGLMHGDARIMLLIPPIPMKARWFVIIFGALELVLGIRGGLWSGDSVAHFAHLGGMLFGLALLVWWKKKRIIYY